MDTDERLSRPDLARDKPRRAFSALAAASAPPAPGPAEPMTADAIIANAVDAAYRVAEENVREGQRAAERLRGGVAVEAPQTEPVRDIAGRLMHLAKELGMTWMDLVMAVVREPELRAVIERLGAADRGAGAAGAAAASRSVSITQRVISRRPVEVTLSPLPAGTADQPPLIGGLHALDAATPPIRQVMFGATPSGGLEVHIAVADDQPLGAYSGAIIDRVTQQPIGILSVRVLE